MVGFVSNWENFQRPDYSNKQKATNYHFYRWQNTNTANNESFSGVLALRSPPIQLQSPTQVPSGTTGARGFSQADGHEVLWLARLGPASFLSCGCDTAARFFRCTLYSH